MPVEFKVPDLGENIESGDIVNWLVKEGDQVEANQSVLEIETGKAVVELPCPQNGKVVKIHAPKGAKVKVGDLLMSLESASAAKVSSAPTVASPAPPAPTKSSTAANATANAPTATSASVASPPAASAAPTRASTPAPTAMPNPAKVPPAGPATRRLARELGIDLSHVTGTGAGGRITEEDVKASVRQGAGSSLATRAAGSAAPAVARSAPLPAGDDARDAWGPVRIQKMTGIRKAIAAAMEHSALTIPHVTNFDDADITELERIRKGGLADYVGSNVKLTMMPFVMKAVAQSLRLHPLLNCSINMQSEQLIFKDYVNIGVAVDTERGLVVPVLRDVDRLSIPRIAQELATMSERARGAQFSLDELKGSTFTISNLGAIGGTYSTPIINAPDVAILLLGRTRKLPVVVDDKIEIRLMMPLSLSYDHRVVDGGAAARFLNEVISYLKVPGRLLLAP